MDNYMIDLNNMSPEEMELAEQKIAEKKYEQLKRRIEDNENETKKIKEKQKELEDDTNTNRTDINLLKEQTNVLCAPTHHKRRNKFSKKASVSDGKLMETQTANYFSDIYPIDCAVLSANAQSCQKCCTLLSVLFCA